MTYPDDKTTRPSMGPEERPGQSLDEPASGLASGPGSGLGEEAAAPALDDRIYRAAALTAVFVLLATLF